MRKDVLKATGNSSVTRALLGDGTSLSEALGAPVKKRGAPTQCAECQDKFIRKALS